MLAFAARTAAFAAACAAFAAVFAAVVGNDYFRIIDACRLIVSRVHRARIAGFAARAAHRAFAVFAAISHSARMFFFFRARRIRFVFVHRAACRSLI